MTPEEREQVYSNEYFEIIIDYNGNALELEKYKDYVVNIINLYMAVVYLPISQLTEDIVSRIGYAALPSLLGLISESSLEASGITRLRNVPNFNLRGRGVLIGIVDTGIDYTNPVFQNADKTTRIASIWDQTIISNNTLQSVSYGTEYRREQINDAIKNDNPYLIVPSKDEIGHGTMLAGIAAGNDMPENDFYGIAPDTELVVVKLKQAKQNIKDFFRMPPDAICYQENDLMFGLQYLFDFSFKENKPISICIAIDTSQYAHDGRGTTSNWLSRQSQTTGTSVVIAAGNEGNARRHYYGAIEKPAGYDTVELNVGPNESGFSMELWGASPNIFSIDILTPSGEYVPRIDITLDETRELSFIFDPTKIYIDYQLLESQSGDQLILMRFTNPSPGIWKFKVYGRGIFPMTFNIWLPMNHFITQDTYFIRSDPYITLLTIGCARIPITVTAYDDKDDSLFIDSGKGYTRINVVKPDVAAPGVNILSPSLDHGFVNVTGTSASAAHTAGVAAMLLEWGIVNGNYKKMNTQDLKMFMIRGARRNTDIQYPNRDWGYGILDVFNIFDSIRSSQ